MMKKYVFPRILGFLALYCVIYIALVMLQFTNKGARFSRQIGTMTISGQYRMSADQEIPADTNEYFLTGGTLVFFGGLEFNLKNRDDQFDKDGFILINAAGDRQPAVPERMILSGDTARFLLPGGTEIVFSALYSGSGPELRISALFGSGVSGLDIPFGSQRSSITRGIEDGRFTVLYEDVYYSFTGSIQGEERGRLLLDNENDSVAYRARPGQKAFNPDDFVIARSESEETFNEAFDRWRDQSFSYWSGNMLPGDEDTVIAYCGESLERGNYEEALASISSTVLPAGQRTYESSVYLGSMPAAQRSFTAAEREKLNRISRLISQNSPDLLKESHAFEFLLIRNYTNYINGGINFIRSIDPETLTLDMVPGIFEGYMDLKQWGFRDDNPFERLIEQSRSLVIEDIQKDVGHDRVFVFLNDRAESAFNLRLGKALCIWAADADNAGWTALGRSLVLSVLSLADDECAVPSALVRSKTGELGEDQSEGSPDGARFSAAKIYRILNPGEYYPRAAKIGSDNSIWAWTAASSAAGVQDNETLDILVTFPVNETHYMIIQGIRPVSRIQIHNRDWPPDSQFERYDSSGWAYYSESRILVLKIKHRDTADQRVRISYYREPPRVVEEDAGETP
jgi:hypothetical protein